MTWNYRLLLSDLKRKKQFPFLWKTYWLIFSNLVVKWQLELAGSIGCFVSIDVSIYTNSNNIISKIHLTRFFSRISCNFVNCYKYYRICFLRLTSGDRYWDRNLLWQFTYSLHIFYLHFLQGHISLLLYFNVIIKMI